MRPPFARDAGAAVPRGNVSRTQSSILRTALILLVSLAAAAFVVRLAPALSAASFNALFRLRGELPAPDDILIVAIDDASLQRVGRWPWPRSVMADALERISRAQPRAIGLDVIYAEESDPEADARLAEAIRRSQRVVLPAQLIESALEASPDRAEMAWLLPLPALQPVVAGIGHAHIAPDIDGVLRSAQLSKADDRAQRLWAFALEVIRISDRIAPEDFAELPGALRFGPYRIPVLDEAVLAEDTPGLTFIRQNEMLINYVGPTMSFRYLSLADVLDDRVPPDQLTGKIVLIGATAPTLGDTRISPFMRYSASGRQGGEEMPGAEVHANIIHTIRGRLHLRPVPEGLVWLLSLAVIGAATLAIRWLDGWRQVVALIAILIAVVLGSLYAFNQHYIIPPLPAMLVGYATVIPLLLLDRTLAASRDLDAKLAALTRAPRGFPLTDRHAPVPLSSAVAFIGAALGAETVALFLAEGGQALRLAAHYGQRPTQDELRLKENRLPASPAQDTQVTLPLMRDEAEVGALAVARRGGEPFEPDERRFLREAAAHLAARLVPARRTDDTDERARFSLPRTLAWKLRAVDDITAQLVARASFMDRVLGSMADGVLVADLTGQIVFANRQAAQVWDTQLPDLAGASLPVLLTESGALDSDAQRRAWRSAIAGQDFTTEFALRSGLTARYYALSLSALVAPQEASIPPGGRAVDEAAPAFASSAGATRVVGFVALISDITKRRELDQVKTETLQLVSHELRTPLHSIQGLSDVLIKFPVAADEAQEMLRTIRSEALRLSETINRYLDIARLESGAQALQFAPVALESLLADCVRALAPLAAEKLIAIKQRVPLSLPPARADAQLLTQAVTNLLSNAIKYSPAGSRVTVEATSEGDSLRLAIRDEGPGLPPGERDRIFEKFYRLERDEASSVVGTGLGLPLAKEIVEQHGGAITVESALGTGSTFIINLPLDAKGEKRRAKLES